MGFYRSHGALSVDHANKKLVSSILGPDETFPCTVRRRSCTASKPEDETIAIAELLGVDVARPLATEHIDADARPRVFFLELKTLPAPGILFDGAPKLRFPGFQWVPRLISAVVGFRVRIKTDCAPRQPSRRKGSSR